MTNMNLPPLQKSSGPAQETFSFENWMENFLRVVMRTSLVVGLLLVIVSPLAVDSIPLLIIYILMYLIILVANLAPFPYRIRAGIFVAIFYVLGIAGLVENGTRGDARLFFAIFMIMVAMFFGYKTTKYTIALTLLAGVIFGSLTLTGTITIVNRDVPIGDIGTWIVAFAEIVLSALVITYGLRLLFQEFGKAQAKAAETVKLLSEEQALLESRVAERTEALTVANKQSQKQAEQLKAIAEVARQIALVRDMESLLPAISGLISEQLGFYHTGIFLLDPQKEYIVLRAANSQGGKAMLERNHKLKVGGSGLVSYAVTMNRPRIALDVGDDAFFFNNPDLPQTRSEMALPLKVGARVLGALDVQSEEPGAFGEDDLDVMQTLADQVALAIENSFLLEESRQRLAELQAISREFVYGQWGEDSIEKRLKGFRYDGQQVEMLQEAVRRSEVQNALASGQIAESQKGLPSIAVPVKVRDQVIGVLNIRSNTANKIFSKEETLFLQSIAERVALSMENARLFREAQKRASKERTIGVIAAQIGEATNMNGILQVAAEEIGRALPGSEVIVQIEPQ